MKIKVILSTAILVSGLANLYSSPCGGETAIQPVRVETESYTGAFRMYGFFEWQDTRSSPNEIPKKYLSKNYSGKLSACAVARSGYPDYGTYGGYEIRYYGSATLSRATGNFISLGTVDLYSNVNSVDGTPCGGDYPLQLTYDTAGGGVGGCSMAIISTVTGPTTKITENLPGISRSIGLCLPSQIYYVESAGGRVSETFSNINSPSQAASVAPAPGHDGIKGNSSSSYANTFYIHWMGNSNKWSPGATNLVTVVGQTSRFRGEFAGICDGDYIARFTFKRENLRNNTALEDKIVEDRVQLKRDPDGIVRTDWKDVPMEYDVKTTIARVELLPTSGCNDRSEPGDSSDDIDSVRWSASLGQNAEGESNGRLRVYLESLDIAELNTDILNFSFSSFPDVGSIRESNFGSLRQLHTDKVLVDIASASQNLAADFNSTSTYAISDKVLYQERVYTSLQDSNTGNTPETNPTFWSREIPDWESASAPYANGTKVWHNDQLWLVTAETETSEEPSGQSQDWQQQYRNHQLGDNTFEVRFYYSNQYPDTKTVVDEIAYDPASPNLNLYVPYENERPYVLYRFELPESAQKDLTITKYLDGSDQPSEYSLYVDDSAATGRWILERGDSAGAQKSIVKTESQVGDERIEIYEERDGTLSSGLMEKTEHRYRNYTNGGFTYERKTLERIWINETEYEETTWNYYESGDHVGRLSEMVHPDGYWETYTYDSKGRPYVTTKQYLDGAKGSTDDAFYEENTVTLLADINNDGISESLNTRIQKIGTNEVYRSYTMVPSFDFSAATTDVDFGALTIEAISDQDGADSTYTNYVVEDAGSTLRLEGNSWKKVTLASVYTPTANTFIQFEMKADSQARIHGIGINATGDTLSSIEEKFALYGTQTSLTGLNVFYKDYSGNDWVTFRIPIGEFLTNDITSLVFFMDDDIENPDKNTWFRNIRLGEITADLEIRHEIACREPGVAWNDADNLVSNIAYYNGGEFDGNLAWRLNSEGTATIYYYSYADDIQQQMDPTMYAFGDLVTVVYNGVPDDLQTPDFIIDGTKTETVTDSNGRDKWSRTYAIFEEDGAYTEVILEEWLVTETDDLGRATRIDYPLDGTYELKTHGCCGLESHTARDGITTTYFYDFNGEIESSSRAGITTRYERIYANGEFTYKTVRVGTDNSEITVSTEIYDLAGNLKSAKGATFDPTTIDRDIATNTTTTTNPDGGTIIRKTFGDGSLKEISGTAANPTSYEYGIENLTHNGFTLNARFTKEILIGEGGSEDEWVKTYTDMFGNTIKVERPSPTGTGLAAEYYYYDTFGRLVRSVDADGVTMIYAYNVRSERQDVAVDVNLNGTIDYGGTDRIQRTLTSYPEYNDERVSATQTYFWDADNVGAIDGTGTVEISCIYSKLGTSSSTAQSWSWSYPNSPYATQTTRIASLDLLGAKPLTTITETLADGSSIVKEIEDGRPKTETRKDSADVILNQTSLEYDSHGRFKKSIDLYNGATEYTYYDDDQIASITTPDPDLTLTSDDYDPQVTSFVYTNDSINGRTDTITLPDNSVQKVRYTTKGQIEQSWGAQTFPNAYTYDSQGRIKTLTTWQNFDQSTGAGISGASVTEWIYNSSGLLQEKWYDGSTAADLSYTYTQGGRLKTRTGGRGIVTTYNYAPGTYDLSGVTYNDGITPAVSYPEYDRRGRIKQITDTSGTRELSYENDQLEDENYIAGTFSGHTIGRKLDNLNRLDLLTLKQGIDELYKVDYGFDDASRLKTVTHGQYTVTYAYDPSAELRETRTFNNGSTDVLKTEHRYDHLNRLKSIQTLDSASQVINAYSYRYNDLNQRERMTLADNSYWEYGYDNLGQVQNAVHKDASDTPFPGRSFGFKFDDIGNRTETNTNGRSATYTPNDLNQYEERQIPRALDVSGDANIDATITVNGNIATRKGEYFYHALDQSSGGNSSQQVDILATATLPDGGDNNVTRFADVEKSEYLPPNPEDFDHDADGNLTQDGKWSYFWDAENRLIAIETLAIAYNAGVPRQKLEFAYDSQGRRFSKKVYGWDSASSNYLLTSSFLYLYDGWNLIAEHKLDSQFSILNSQFYTWGIDLSGSLQDAGGVGGLLIVTDMEGLTYYPTFDGNGNVMGYYAADTGESAAEFEYGPFGELIRATGEKKDDFNFRFSTKYEDTETGLMYYGYRYYNAETGRWLSRDPIEEQGGLNLYAMVGNNAINDWDYLGLITDSSLGLYVFGDPPESLREQMKNRPLKCCQEKVFFDDLIFKDVNVGNLQLLGITYPIVYPHHAEDGESFWEYYKRHTKLTKARVGYVHLQFDLTASVSIQCKKINKDCTYSKKGIEFPSFTISNLNYNHSLYETWTSDFPGVAYLKAANWGIKITKGLIKGVENFDELKLAVKLFLGGEEALDRACEKIFEPETEEAKN